MNREAVKRDANAIVTALLDGDGLTVRRITWDYAGGELAVAVADVVELTLAVAGTDRDDLRRAQENLALAAQIRESGAVVSQFWPNAPPRQSNFPRRNITMSGLGQGTVVIEASATSGAKMQARLAIEHGKQVFLLDSLVKEHPWARNYVAERGAHRVHSVDDILNLLRSPEEINAQVKVNRQMRLAL